MAASQLHSFGGRRKVTIRGSVAPKNDIVSFFPRRLFFYRVYWRSFSKAHNAAVVRNRLNLGHFSARITRVSREVSANLNTTARNRFLTGRLKALKMMTVK